MKKVLQKMFSLLWKLTLLEFREYLLALTLPFYFFFSVEFINHFENDRH